MRELGRGGTEGLPEHGACVVAITTGGSQQQKPGLLTPASHQALVGPRLREAISGRNTALSAAPIHDGMTVNVTGSTVNPGRWLVKLKRVAVEQPDCVLAHRDLLIHQTHLLLQRRDLAFHG